MTTDRQDDAAQNGNKRRVRGPAKPYPPLSLEEALVPAKTILQESVSDQMRRLRLFDRLGRSPDSGSSRRLITASSRYGLTKGSYSAEYIELTDEGRAIATQSPTFTQARERAFQCAIGQFEPFSSLYQTLRNRRIPASDILRDEIEKYGVPKSDAEQAATIFLANARYVGLIQESSGSERMLPIEHVLEETVTEGEEAPAASEDSSPIGVDLPSAPSTRSEMSQGPSLHIDVQVHIDSSATSDQIEQIFASMAKHLYSKDG